MSEEQIKAALAAIDDFIARHAEAYQIQASLAMIQQHEADRRCSPGS